METFQQPKITGYRQLSEEEVDLMQRTKNLSNLCGEFIAYLRRHKDFPVKEGDNRNDPALDQRWISIGATQVQQGFMAIIRGIAKPESF